MRCATYPPPPGSAPGYHAAHHCTDRNTRSATSGIQAYASIPDGPNETGSTESAARSLPNFTASPALSASMPPTASTAYTARMITADILITNCTRSVQSTAHIPAADEYATVITKQKATAAIGEMPSVIVRILIIARVTQPRMMRLMGMAR